MRRFVLSSQELEPEFPFPRLGSADHVKIALPDPATGELVLPEIGHGAGGPQVRASAAPLLREYTIRSVDHAARELSIDFVLHEHGPAGQWAIDAAPGDRIGVLGPRGSHIYPSDRGQYLLVADETGLPAIERFLEELPGEAAVRVVVLGQRDSTRPLTGASSAKIDWLTPIAPEAAADAIVETVGGIELGRGVFIWGAGEATVMRALRSHLRDVRQLDVAQVEVRGYWRHGTAGSLGKESS